MSQNGVSVVIATRNRGSSIVETIESVRSNTGLDYEIIVVDQSSDERTTDALQPYRTDPEFTILDSTTVGQSRAINEALAVAKYDLIAMTDDDCEVPFDWLQTVRDSFATYPTAGVAFYRVVAGPHDADAGWIPDFPCTGERLARRWYHRLGRRGMGAAMAARRSTLDQIGRFDEELGVGTPLRAANDLDVAARAMLAGWDVLESSRSEIVHHGFRTMQEGRQVTAGFIGIGAMHMKLIRSGHPTHIVLALADITRLGLLPALRDLAQARRPRTLRRVQYFLSGALTGSRLPIDKCALLFRIDE